MAITTINKTTGTWRVAGTPPPSRAFIGIDDDTNKFYINPDGTLVPVLTDGVSFEGLTNTLDSTGSSHFLSISTTVPTAAGSSTASAPVRLGNYFGYLTGSNLSATANRTVSVHGVYGISGTNASTWEKAAIEAEIHSGTNTADAAFAAVLGGGGVESNTTATAAFQVITQNAGVASGFAYGVDLYPPALGTYGQNSFTKADIRMSGDVVVLNASGVPTNGTSGTGAAFAGPGSIYTNTATGLTYTNSNTKASPTWATLLSDVRNFESLTNTLANATGSSHFQAVTTTIPSGAGSSSGAGPSRMGSYFAFLAGANLTATANRTVGMHSVYGVTGTHASAWEKAAVEAEIHNGTTTADAAYIATLGGDTSKTTAKAAFMVQTLNSLVGPESGNSGFDYGMDMYPAAIVGTAQNVFKKADVRLSFDVEIFSIAGSSAPVNGTSGTGAGHAGKGSLCMARGSGVWYTNTGTLGSPTWTIVGTQS